MNSAELKEYNNPNYVNNSYIFYSSYSINRQINSNYYYTNNNSFLAKKIEISDVIPSEWSREEYGFSGFAFYNSRNPFESDVRNVTTGLTQYIASDSQIRNYNISSYEDYLNLPISTFNKNYKIVFNLSYSLKQSRNFLGITEGDNFKKLEINPSDLRINQTKNYSINLLNKESYDGDNLIAGKSYGKSFGSEYSPIYANYAKNNKINTDFYGRPISGYKNDKKDKFSLNLNYSLTLASDNKLKFVFSPLITTTNDGNQNRYAFDSYNLNLSLDSIEIKPINWTIIKPDKLKANIDQAFIKPISSEVYNEPQLSKNKVVINNLVNERLNQKANLLGYYLQSNYSNWFKWNLSNYDDTNKTVDINFEYKPFYSTNNNSWNRYVKRVKVNLVSSAEYTTRKFAENVWERLLIDNSRISYNPSTGVVVAPQLDLSNNNPWRALNKQPYPQNPNQKIAFPDFGTWLINSNTKLEYNSLPNQNEDVIVNNQTLDSLNGKYSFLMFDPATKNKDQQGESNEYTIEIYGNKNSEYSLLFKIKFIVKALYPNTNIIYRNWDPSKYPLDQWQASWITKPSNDSPNPDFMPNINEKSGLAEQIVWVYNKNNRKVSPFDISQNDYNHLTFPDPIDENGKLLYDLSPYIDKKTHQLIDPSKLNVSDEIIEKVGNGFIAKGIVSPKGIEQEFDNSSKRIIRNLAYNNLSIDNFNVDLSNSNNKLEYLDKKGIYKYTTYDNSSKLYGSTYVVIGDDVGKKQTFSQYINELNGNETIVIPFWESTQGSHLASYLREEVKLNLEEIRSLSYEQVQAWWNIYVKNAILKADNPTSKTYDLRYFLLSNIKTSFNDAEKLKTKILEQIQKAMDLWSGKLDITNKQNELVKFMRNEHYTINAVDGSSFDDIDWERLISNNNKINKLEVILSAVSPNVYLTGNKKITILNSNSYQNIFDLNQINLETLNHNTQDRDQLAKDIKNYINNRLKKATKLKITFSDWYIVNDLDEAIAKLININEANPTQKVELTINASEDSDKLSGYGFLVVNNSLKNKSIIVDENGNITNNIKNDSGNDSSDDSDFTKLSNLDKNSKNEFLENPASVAGLVIGSTILLFSLIILILIIINKKKSNQFRTIDLNLATNSELIDNNNETLSELNPKEIIVDLSSDRDFSQDDIEEIGDSIDEDDIKSEEKIDDSHDSKINNDHLNEGINDYASNDEKDFLPKLDQQVKQIEEAQANLDYEKLKDKNKKEDLSIKDNLKVVIDKSDDSLELEKTRVAKLSYEDLQKELITIEEKLLETQTIIDESPVYLLVEDKIINEKRVELIYKKEMLEKLKSYILELVNTYELRRKG
ncbi:hypothetical protein LNO75_00435 [Mycoplasma sp. T363T]|uniref:hypothetical protein n=1 Tax=Mycoplasma bradburyae TaxID=2963128 RepID=UPI00234177FD|nr:hypothetical protein [Mycoplasma bradburyae]MDC4163048.1 hypothetical protein [Mycoplasma bradburyae]